MVDPGILDDVLLTLRLAALLFPGRELTTMQIAATCWVSRPPSCFPMSEAGAAEALKQLRKDGYAAVRKARRNLWKLNPEDARPSLPAGFRYETRIGGGEKRTSYEVIVTPKWSLSGGRICLFRKGDAAAISPLYTLTSQYQRRGGRPLSEKEALAWIGRRAETGVFRTDGKFLFAPLSDAAALRALVALESHIDTYEAAITDPKICPVARV